MRREHYFLSLLLVMGSCSCVPEITTGPLLSIDIEKQEVSVNEKITITGIYDQILTSKENTVILYAEDYPEDYEIIKGKLYEQMTDDKYLCITPEPYKPAKYKFELQISFDTPGEHVLKINGCSSREKEIQRKWGQEYFTYTFLVNE